MKVISFRFNKHFGSYDMTTDKVVYNNVVTNLKRAEVGIKEAIWQRAINIVKAREYSSTPRVYAMRERKAQEGTKTRSYMIDREALEAIEYALDVLPNATKNHIVNEAILEYAMKRGYTPQNVSGDTQ